MNEWIFTFEGRTYKSSDTSSGITSFNITFDLEWMNVKFERKIL